MLTHHHVYFLAFYFYTKAARAQTKRSAVLNTPSTTALVTKNQNLRCRASCAPLGPTADMAGRFPGVMHRGTRPFSSQQVISWSRRVGAGSGGSAWALKWSSLNELSSASNHGTCPSPTARREAPGLSSCPTHTLDFINPEGPAAALLYSDIISEPLAEEAVIQNWLPLALL